MLAPLDPIKDVKKFIDYLTRRLFSNPCCWDCVHYQGVNRRGFYLCDIHYPGEDGSDAWGRNTLEPCEDFRFRRFRVFVVLEFEGEKPEEIEEQVKAVIKDLKAIKDMSVWVEPTDDRPRPLSRDRKKQTMREMLHAWSALVRTSDVKLGARATVVTKSGPGYFLIVRGDRRGGSETEWEVQEHREMDGFAIPGLENFNPDELGLTLVKVVRMPDKDTWEEWAWQKGEGTSYIKAKWASGGWWSSVPWFL